MKFSIAVAGVKGGIGKSTISFCLAYYYSVILNFPVNLIDLDSCNSSLELYDLGDRKKGDHFIIGVVYKILDNYINIIDLPANDALAKYKDILKQVDVIIFPCTTEINDYKVLEENTLKHYLLKPKEKCLVIFNKLKINEQFDNLSVYENFKSKVTFCNQGILYSKKFFSGLNQFNPDGSPIITDDEVTKKLKAEKGINTLIHNINYFIFRS